MSPSYNVYLPAMKHPKTKKPLIGGFNPLWVSQKPFGYSHTELCCAELWCRCSDEDPED